MGGTNCKCAQYFSQNSSPQRGGLATDVSENERNKYSSSSSSHRRHTDANGSRLRSNPASPIYRTAGASSNNNTSTIREPANVPRRGSGTTNAPFSSIADDDSPAPAEGTPRNLSSSGLGRMVKERVEGILKGGSNSNNRVGVVDSNGSFFSSSGHNSVHIGETGRRKRTLENKYKGDRGFQILIEEELASRATILSEYELEANRISNRHPLSPMSIASYSTEKHLVFIRHGKAYDATKWFEIHPGGKFVLLKYAGKDVSDVFDRFHSRRTKNELIKEVLIGKVWTGRGVSTCGLHGYDSGASNLSPGQTSSSQHHNHHHYHASPAAAHGYSGGITSMMLSPTGSDHGDFEGRIVRVKPLTKDGSVIRIYIAFPERLLCDLGGSIVIKHKGTARNYSPCFIEETNFSLVIKRYERGIVSNYLFSKKIGDCLEFDGPYAPKASVPDKPFKTLLLIGQGTGIVPVLEVARTVVAETIYFVSCYSSISDVLFSKELSLLPESVRLIYFIPRADLTTDRPKVPGLLFNSRICAASLTFAMGVAGGSTMTSLAGVDVFGNPIPTANSTRSEDATSGSIKRGILSAPIPETSLAEKASTSPKERCSDPSLSSLVEYAMICGSFTFYDDVKRMLETEMGIPTDRIMQL